MRIQGDLEPQTMLALMSRVQEVCSIRLSWVPALICFERMLTCSAAEGRAAKRFQRSISEKNLPVRRPDLSNAVTNNPEAKPLFGHQRRQSIRDPNASPIATALQSSPTKR